MAPPSVIGPLCLIRPTKQFSILVAPVHDWLRYFIWNSRCTVVHFKRIHFSPHKHWWPLPISTFYDVTQPVESQYHQHWSFFVVPSIFVSLAVTRNYFRHRLQNPLLMCWILLHLLRQYRSGFPNTLGGGITTLGFIVKMWLGDITTSLLTSLIISATISLELTMASTSAKKVLSDSWSRLILCVLIRNDSKVLADLICLFHTPRIWYG